jgi:hypothetical protein
MPILNFKTQESSNADKIKIEQLASYQSEAKLPRSEFKGKDSHETLNQSGRASRKVIMPVQNKQSDDL